MNDVDDLVKSINAAFKSRQRGAGISLSEARQLDDHRPMSEAGNQQGDLGENWSSVSDILVEAYADVFPFLCETSFCYYLPRYMVYALLNKSSGSFARDAAVYALSNLDHYGSYFKLLSKSEKQAVAEFLIFASTCQNYEEVDLDGAIRRYWSQWLPVE